MVSKITVLFLLLALQRHILLNGDEMRDAAMLVEQWRNRFVDGVQGAVLSAINHRSTPHFAGQNGLPEIGVERFALHAGIQHRRRVAKQLFRRVAA